ncbi:hypothetical protein ACS0TY_021308 [Phlomoides rotata]
MELQLALASHRLRCPTYLLYADDILIFYAASRANTHRLKFILDRYANISGQVFNPAKSKLYFGKHVPTHNHRYVRFILGIGLRELPFIYLGVPLFRGVPKALHLCVLWAKACATKEEGGLGIRSIKLMNEAFLHKLAWTMLIDTDASMGFIRAHFWKDSVAHAHIPSSVWSGLRPYAIRISGEGR